MKVKNTASAKNLRKLYRNEKGADVVFVFKSKLSDEEFRVPAHKAILAASSLVFDRMFYGDLKEGAEVEITDVSFEGFCEFLQFFYVDEMEITEENMSEFFRMVDKYDVQESFPDCNRLLLETVTNENVCFYYDLALTFNYPEELMKHFDETISRDAVHVLKTSSFKNSSRTLLRKIL